MKPRILVVDDEESIRFTFGKFLMKDGFEVLSADSYEGALLALSREQVDIVVADIVLGDHTGTDILKEVKEKGLSCPVIMITGQPNVQSAAESVRQGAFDYVCKPVQKETLLRIAHMALDRKRLMEDRDRVEQEKEQYRKNLKAIFRSIRDAIVTVDTEMHVVEANEATREICGVQPEDIIGKPYLNGAAHCPKSCVPVLQETIEKGVEIRERRIQCGHGMKPGRVVVVNSSPLLNPRDQVSGAVLTVRDVTRLNELERELKVRNEFHQIVGRGNRMQQIFGLLEDLAPTDTTVLITGESGTGKEVVARALHDSSVRAFKPLVSVSCSALAENLLESELFGHVKGAFTGAVANKKGRFQVADGGTIFLDEIGDISPLIQLKLLRVLQEREFERVGDSMPMKVDVRVIAASNKDLREKVRRGTYREDLYYRLKVVEISIPPLRERAEDIPLLVEHFRDKFNRGFKKCIVGIHDDVLDLFMNYPWPGNVRELEHALEHAFVLCHEETILPKHLPHEVAKGSFAPPVTGLHPLAGSGGPQGILNALKQSGWNKARTARLLGMSRQTLYRKLKDYNLGSSCFMESSGTEM